MILQYNQIQNIGGRNIWQNWQNWQFTANVSMFYPIPIFILGIFCAKQPINQCFFPPKGFGQQSAKALCYTVGKMILQFTYVTVVNLAQQLSCDSLISEQCHILITHCHNYISAFTLSLLDSLSKKSLWQATKYYVAHNYIILRGHI